MHNTLTRINKNASDFSTAIFLVFITGYKRDKRKHMLVINIFRSVKKYKKYSKVKNKSHYFHTYNNEQIQNY